MLKYILLAVVLLHALALTDIYDWIADCSPEKQGHTMYCQTPPAPICIMYCRPDSEGRPYRIQ